MISRGRIRLLQSPHEENGGRGAYNLIFIHFRPANAQWDERDTFLLVKFIKGC